ncbi:lipid A export ATP-binding/permease protein MsbA [mine drainage metagenome]|uniref:Lipid A export ATP-binding/permease protein MsbA n=1 Tax=mine drainage metagenome TaxID=410659 RepID=A0A1J5T443_9ZZZZ
MKKYARLFKYIRSQSSGIALYFVFSVLSILFSLVSFSGLPVFLNIIFKKGNIENTKPDSYFEVLKYINYELSQFMKHYGDRGAVMALGLICLLILISVFLKNLFFYLSFYVLAPIKMGVVTKLRGELYNKLLQLPIGYFTDQRKGDVMSRMTNDIAEIETSVVGTLEGLIKDPINVLIILIALVFISPILSLFLFIFLPLTAFVIGRISRSLKKQSNISAIQLGELLSTLEETLTGLRVIKAFNAEHILRGKFLKTNTDLFHIRRKMQLRRDLASPLSEFLGVLVLIGILWIGGKLVLTSSVGLPAEGFIMYIILFSQIINPAKSLSTSFYNMQKGSAAIARIEEILQAPVKVDENENGKQITSFNHSIEFKNVNFLYEDKVILKNINLTIKKGKTVALVGSSGAGKSTLADLIPRFHDVSGGELLIDGINIKDYSLHSVRTLMGIVTQEPILFNDTIANNISLGMQHATKEQIISAAKIANADNYISAKEEGYDTNIGDRGNKLSGGERQRLTIARAVLKNPPILILDEATSSLDTESERLVQDAINNMMQNRTSIVIAHRLSTIRHADEIIVLQQGEIIERGHHDDLMELGGMYKRLVEMQELK